MLQFKHCLFFLMLLAVPMVRAQSKSTNIQTIDGKKYYIHKTEKSQSLYAISKLYSVSIEELYLINPELKSGLKIHQEFKVPFISGAENMPTKTLGAGPATIQTIDTNKYQCYKVNKGETLYSILRKYNLSEKQLTAYNPILIEGLKEGQILVVGEKTKRKAPTVKESKETKAVVLVKELKSGTSTVDSNLFKPVFKPKKGSYNIALILPFKLDATINLDLNDLLKNNGNFPNVPALAIDFYLGFKRAVDSLSTKDYELNMQLYDVDERDTLKIIELAASQKFKELDFIFGPFYANGFKTITKKAKELHIPIVLPITTQNKILYNNPYVSKTNPSQFTLLESLADYCIDSLKSEKAQVILMSGVAGDKKEAQFVNAFKKYFNEKIKSLGLGLKDTVLVAKGIEGLKKAYVPGIKNVVVTVSSNEVFIADFTTQLAIFADKKDIVLCGWQSISLMDNIDQAYLNQLQYTFAHPYNITNMQAFQTISNEYRTQQGASPGDYFYIGFDIAEYYLKHLKEFGPEFIHALNTHPAETNYTRFKYTRPDLSTGFDNRGVYVFRYNNYQIQKTGWK